MKTGINMKPKPSLSYVRREAGLTQRDLAARLGVHEHTVARWEAGRARVFAEYVRPLATAVGITPEEILMALEN